MSAPIELVDYDPAWPMKFEAEKQLLIACLRPWLFGPIEHVGSTPVPGLLAKPVIDIMVAVETLSASRDAIGAVEGLGYQYWPYKAELMHWLCKPSDEFRTHHLHLVPLGGPLWQTRLAFRDYLRRHPAAAAEYAALENELAAKYRDDREAYTEGKTAFILRIVERALRESGLPPHE
jgi:GrpB-like predicted nucleotidyltransferase (UPF0157 family)